MCCPTRFWMVVFFVLVSTTAGWAMQQGEVDAGTVYDQAMSLLEEASQSADVTEAIKLLEQNVSKANHSNSLFLLGSIYQGDYSDVPNAPVADFVKAERYFRLAAERGCAESAANLAIIFGEGRARVPQDATQAKFWQEEAVRLGYDAVNDNLGIMSGDEGIDTDSSDGGGDEGFESATPEDEIVQPAP